MDAAWLGRVVLFEGATVGAVVSGLPLLNMSTRKVVSILSGAFGHMRPGSGFLSIHIWYALSRAAAGSRQARPEGGVARPCHVEYATGRSLPSDKTDTMEGAALAREALAPKTSYIDRSAGADL